MDSSAHHVGLIVRDLDLTLEFYRNALDPPVVSRFEVGGEEFATAVSVDGASARLARLDDGDVHAEPVEYDPVGTNVDEPTLNRPGATHLGLSAEDVDTAVAQLPADVETLSEPQTTETGTRIVFVCDPEGNLVEFLDA